MQFHLPTQPAILIKRYKRFLADVTLEDGSTITVHCPNSGSMRSCAVPGSKVIISRASNPKRKYPFTLEMIRVEGIWIGINTSLTNHLVAEAIKEGRVKELQNIDTLKKEIKTSAKSRLDLLLTRGDEKIYVEIKNCSLVEDGYAMFPDSVTARGTKHLLELADLVAKGNRGIIFFCVQRADNDHFKPAAHIDPLYAETLNKVHSQGVEILVYQADVNPQGITVQRPLPFTL